MPIPDPGNLGLWHQVEKQAEGEYLLLKQALDLPEVLDKFRSQRLAAATENLSRRAFVQGYMRGWMHAVEEHANRSID